MAFLPARRLVRRFAQAAHPGRLLQSIAGGRLAAVAAVQAEPALQLGDTGLQSCNLGRLRPDQCNQFFPRRLRLRIAIHESLNRNAIPLSRKIYRREFTKAARLPGQLPKLEVKNCALKRKLCAEYYKSPGNINGATQVAH